MITREFRSIDGEDDEWLGLLVRVIRMLDERVAQGKTQRTLSAREEEECRRHGCGTKSSIYITGQTEKRAANIILVNGMRVIIGDVPFALFLRLAVELFRNKKGAVPKSTLIRGGYIRADGEFQAIARLRQAFTTALDSFRPEELIESCEHRSLRLSIDPSLIEYSRNGLLLHRNKRIRRLAARLP